jgi:hypothetical protein
MTWRKSVWIPVAAILSSAASFAYQIAYMQSTHDVPYGIWWVPIWILNLIWLCLGILSVRVLGLRGLWTFLPVPFAFFIPIEMLAVVLACTADSGQCL